jgi:hypothetical protein
VTAVLNVGDVTERVRVPTPNPPPYNAYDSEPRLAAAPSRSKLPIILLAAAGAIPVRR